MKILIVTDAWAPQLNGVVRTYENLKEKLIEAEHEVYVISPQDFPNCKSMPGYKEIDLALFPYKKMKTLINNLGELNTIHIATEGPLGWAARKYCIKHNKKFTTSYHTQFPDYFARRVCKYFPFLYKSAHSIGIKYVREFHKPSNALLVTTQSMADQLISWEFKPQIYPFTKGIDKEIFNLGDATLFKDLQKPIALYVGRLAIEKNIEDFLKMTWKGSKILVGHGPDENMLKKKYPDAIFAGKKTSEELANHYRSANVFVFPSRTDTFGIVLIEALACGLPIAAYDVIGPRDVITSDKLGYLYDDLSVAAHEAMYCGSQQERHDHVREKYTWAIAMDNFLNASK